VSDLPATNPPAASQQGMAAEKLQTLLLIAAAQFLGVLDASVVNVALPSIGSALDFSVAQLPWVVNAYVLTFGGFLLLGGRMADLIGRRTIFMAGLTVFAIASLTAGLAQNEAMLIISRAVQGLGGAMLSPAALSILTATFSEGKERNTALGVWGAVAGAGGAVGVLLGGVLTQYLSWRWVFLINVPVVAVALVLAPRVLAADPVRDLSRSFDIPGAVTITTGLSLFVYALLNANSVGWGSAETLLLIAGSLALVGIFVVIEQRASDPLVPFDIFGSQTRNGSYMVGLLLAMSLFSMFFFVSIYMQRVLGWDALKAGLAYLPLATTIIIGAGVGSTMANRYGFKPILIVGMLCISGGLLGFAQISPHGTFLGSILGPSVLAALGLGLSFPAATIGGTSGVTDDEAGLASGLINSAQQIGGALGLAILSAIATATTNHQLSQAGGLPRALPAALTDGFQAAWGELGGGRVETLLRQDASPLPADFLADRAGQH